MGTLDPWASSTGFLRTLSAVGATVDATCTTVDERRFSAASGDF